MKELNFQPKVKQLEQVRIDFEESLPLKVNSKSVFDKGGPSNNKRPLIKAGLGFVSADERHKKLVIPGQNTITKIVRTAA